jgi:hypothetical protein
VAAAAASLQSAAVVATSAAVATSAEVATSAAVATIAAVVACVLMYGLYGQLRMQCSVLLLHSYSP